MNWQHCEAISGASLRLVRVEGDMRRERFDTSGTIEPFPNAFAE
ncbi:hypothetical protein [Caballeronia sp. J97]|nr:hypothetical protein [Caballeronia sp. J97]